jgi:KTSC domain
MVMNEIKSSAIKAIGYDPRLRRMRISFASGGIYEYQEVSLLDFAELMNSNSKGSHFHNHVKPYYEGEQIDE